MRGRIVVQGLRIGMVAAAAAVFTASPSAAQQTSPTFSKDIAPIFQAKCQECHQPNSIAPMSLISYKEARPWARAIKDRVDAHADAALAYRPVGRRAPASRTTCRCPRRRSTRSCAGWTPARREGDPKDLPAPKPLVTDNRVAGRARRLRPARPRHPVDRVQDAGAAPGRLVPPDAATCPITEPRWVKMVEIRPTEHEGPQDRPPLDRLSRAERRPGRGQHRHRQRAVAGPASPRGPGEPPPAADGMGDRQGLRPVPRGHRQADRPGREDLVGSAPARRRRGDHRRLRDRAVVLPEGPGAEEAQLPDRLHRAAQREFLDIPPNSIALHRRVHGAQREHADHQLPAALPPARQGDEGRGDPAGRQPRDHQLRRQLQLQLDDQLHLRGRCLAGLPQGHRRSR